MELGTLQLGRAAFKTIFVSLMLLKCLGREGTAVAKPSPIPVDPHWATRIPAPWLFPGPWRWLASPGLQMRTVLPCKDVSPSLSLCPQEKPLAMLLARLVLLVGRCVACSCVCTCGGSKFVAQLLSPLLSPPPLGTACRGGQPARDAPQTTGDTRETASPNTCHNAGEPPG